MTADSCKATDDRRTDGRPHVSAGHRLGPPLEGPAQELVDSGFHLENADAPLLHAGLNRADLAHVLDLRARGVVPEQPARRLLALLLEADRTTPEDFPYDPAFGEPYNSRERHFISQIGDDAGWLHAGRPRREAVRIALRLHLRTQVVDLIEAGAALAETLAETAAEHSRTWMPDQTYLQHAQPSTYGHYLLSFAYPVLRDVRSLVGTQSKLAEDLEIWASSEFDYVTLSDGYSRSSVLMPQKRNPYALSIIRGASGTLIGRVTGFLAVVKSPSARSDNLIYAYGEVPRALDLALRTTRLTNGVARTLQVNTARMWSALEAGYCQATDLAEYVMQTCDVDYRTAYQVVGIAVRRANAAGLRGIDLDGAMLDDAAREYTGRPIGLTGRDLVEILDPRHIVATRTAAGGAAPPVVEGMAASCREQARELRDLALARREGFQAADRCLLDTAEAFASGADQEDSR
jgi:argininosuccinate lyase